MKDEKPGGLCGKRVSYIFYAEFQNRSMHARANGGPAGTRLAQNGTASVTPELFLQSCLIVIKVVGLGGMLIAVSVAAIVLLLKSVPLPKPNKPGSEKRDTNQDISSDHDSTMTMEGPDVKLLPVSSDDDES